MMAKPTEKQIKEALTKTLNAYDELIDDVEGNKHKWGDYGSTKTCRLCDLFAWRCSLCPLRGCAYGTAPGTLEDLRKVVNKETIAWRKYKGIGKKPTNSEIKKAAIARRDWLINKIAEKGYIYK